MKFAKPFSFISISCLLAIALLGCSTFSDNPKSLNSGALEPQAILKFSDVPVPVGLKSLPQASYSFESSGVRVGVLKYQGKANADQVIGFYKEQMAIYNWNLVNIVEYGQRLINFERENETCIITIEPKGNTVILTISLGPKSQNLAKKARAPVK
ncbi:MAG: hypothetical protein PHG87_02310 [Candidatus Omnitrophica bacterium]|nr:hypothetical protein [Candidatus Omnitrophota bacterium]